MLLEPRSQWTHSMANPPPAGTWIILEPQHCAAALLARFCLGSQGEVRFSPLAYLADAQSKPIGSRCFQRVGGGGRNRTGFHCFFRFFQLSQSQPYRMTGSEYAHKNKEFIIIFGTCSPSCNGSSTNHHPFADSQTVLIATSASLLPHFLRHHSPPSLTPAGLAVDRVKSAI